MDPRDGVTITHNYFPNSSRLSQLISGSRQNLSYTYDKVSDIKGIIDGIGRPALGSATMSSISYDALHRLTGYSRASGTTNFSYDSVGNISLNGEFGTGAYGYGVRMPSAVKTANGTKYAYDANGKMIVRNTQRLALRRKWFWRGGCGRTRRWR